MKYYLLLLLVLVSGCQDSEIVPALVNFTCYDKDGNVTIAERDYRGSIQIVNDPSRHYKSQKCIIERVE